MEQPDAVMLLTPNQVHGQQVAEVAPLHCPVFVEKPLATTAESLNLVLDSLSINPRLYCSDFYPDVRALPLKIWLGQKVEWVKDPVRLSGNVELWNQGPQTLGRIQRVEAVLLEGKDETGRYHQYARFLEKLVDSHSGLEVFTDQWGLYGARALVVTLGELGSIYWKHESNAWSAPLWCIGSRFSEKSKDGEGRRVLPLSEVRDGLGCGDCARAGFVAAIACLTNFSPVAKDEELSSNSVDAAVAWLNWFGLQKLRHFGLEEYLEFLKGQKTILQKALKVSPKIEDKKLKLGTEGDYQDMNVEPALKDGNLHEWLVGYLKTPTVQIKELENKWRSARGFPPRD